jgi:hypothetical protein
MKRKWLITYEDIGAHRLIDKQTESSRVLKLKADKRDDRWTDKARGKEQVRLTDDGNGYDIVFAEGLQFRLDAGQAADLLLLLKHLDETGNHFCDGLKTEIV